MAISPSAQNEDTSSIKTASAIDPVVVPKGQHPMTFSDISENALSVLRRLNSKGYDAYLVGGCIRDKLMGKTPKDFDIATNATPEQIKACFRNCRLIGRRFRLAHIVFGKDIIEVATFRGHHADLENNDAENKVKVKARSGKQVEDVLAKQDQQGQLLRDNVFGTIDEDAERRDFTFNAMYFSAKDQSIIDFAHGLRSIQNKRVELIGDPATRFREDPVRMIRAVRFAAKLGMSIPDELATQFKELGHLLGNIPPARLFEEVLKLFISGSGVKTFQLLHQHGLFGHLFPQFAPLLVDDKCREMQLVMQVLKNTDERINNEQRVTPAFLYAAFLWYPVEERAQTIINESGITYHDAFNIAMGEVLHRQIQRIMIPKRFSIAIREIWQLQTRLPKRFGRRAFQTLSHARFRAAYDFLLIRGQIEGGDLMELGEWWTEFQEVSPEERKTMLNVLRKEAGPARKRKPRPKKKAN
ncbi:polynucleotide adenylyltransferase PcnB [Glaciecola sp. MH2013]|uniref:polynucleotide adenylyltransferase PcnB n=1 Tax=Glaciecola sp. MH2013 TaxID=2785524 RepID=UPI00189F4EF4|nr:polynucleotide adenylyltransferase PcnB [Glaciecola sp. MH2013]MBF7073828.1 polynucleotide adenylyltransferase PcnB [Glaciecola sp. MH2013]